METNTPDVIHNVVEKRIALRRVIRSLCEVAEFQLKTTSRPTSDRIEHVEEMIHDMSEELAELIELKKTDRFFAEILQQAPERQHTVDQIMKDYEQLLVDLERMKEELSQTDHAPTVRRLLHGWLTRFLGMDSREVTLLQEVWNVDIGSMD